MTDNRTTELLPCPFCGSNKAYPNIELGKHWIECCECTAESGCYRTEAEAIAAWNTRAPVEYEGWFYLPKPKNSLVHYGTPQIEKMENGYKAKQPVEIIESAIRAWGDELGEHIMKRICEVWNTRTHGTLTAEQVREAIERHSAWVIGNNRCFHDGAYEEIADELNTELGSGTCELEPLSALDVTLNMLDSVEWGACSECGCAVPMDAKFCNECGKAVKR